MASGSRRRGRIFIYIGLILILGLVLVWALTQKMSLPFISKPQPTPATSAEMVNIVVTTQQVQKGTEFTEAVLATIPYPKAEIGEGTFYTNIGDLVGKKAKIDLDPKIPVTSSLVVDKAEGSLAAFQIPKGMVAVSVPINRLSSVSYAPQAGDHVNVIVTLLLADLDTNFQTQLPNLTAGVITPGPMMLSSGGSVTQTASSNATEVTGITALDVHQNLMAQIETGGPGSSVGRAEIDTGLGQPIYVIPSEVQRPRMVSQTLLQDAMVLQIGNFETPGVNTVQAAPTPAAAGQTDQQAAAAAAVKPPDIITLVVSPQDAITLNFLMLNRAQIALALRGAGDDQRIQTEAVTLQYLMDQYNIPVPAKLPYGMEPRVDQLVAPALPNDQPAATPK
jgi:Flp pilus assembly protein CpaB